MTRSAYGYVYGNPLNMTDPTGLCGWTDPWDCVVPDDMSGIGEYVRPVINTLNGSNGIGAAIAIAGGGNCYTRGGRIECDNVGMIGSGQTYGDIVLNPGRDPLRQSEFEHESNHSNQWAMFGSAAGFGLAYGGDWLWHGTKRECMWFETAADAGKGNYGSCPGNGTLIDWVLGSSSAAADMLCEDPNRR